MNKTLVTSFLFALVLVAGCAPKKQVTTTVYPPVLQPQFATAKKYNAGSATPTQNQGKSTTVSPEKMEKQSFDRSAPTENIEVSEVLIDSIDLFKWETHSISAGTHYAQTSNLTFWPYDSMNFYIRFDSSTIYQTQRAENQHDWNKVMGFSDCNSMHHQNSIRLVWRYSAEKGIELGGYAYTNGKRAFKSITTTKIDQISEVSIVALRKKYVVTVNEKSVDFPRACSSRFIAYQLFPYFGGDESAPTDIAIFISWKE